MNDNKVMNMAAEHGRVATVSSSILVTWLRCSIASSA